MAFLVVELGALGLHVDAEVEVDVGVDIAEAEVDGLNVVVICGVAAVFDVFGHWPRGLGHWAVCQVGRWE